MERALGRKTPWAVVPALLLACSSGFACWTSGGLETQLFTLLVVIAIDGVVAAGRSGPRAIHRAAHRARAVGDDAPEGLLVAGVLGVVQLIATLVATAARIASCRRSATRWSRSLRSSGCGRRGSRGAAGTTATCCRTRTT